jgi:hypothetical protein
MVEGSTCKEYQTDVGCGDSEATLVVGIANSRTKKVFVYAWIVCSRFLFTKYVVLGSIIRCLSIDDSAQLLYPKP